MTERTTPYWPDVKDNPDKRIDYHNEHFQVGLEALEEITQKMLKDHAGNHFITGQVGWIRQMADSMVKCFNQMYCDINQGFPGYHVMWLRNEESDRINDERYIFELNELIKHRGIKNIVELREFIDEVKDVGMLEFDEEELECMDLEDQLECLLK